MDKFRFPTMDNEVAELRLDQSLLHAVQEASELERVITEVFALLRDPVYRYLTSTLGLRAEAEELTQETFLRLLMHLQKGQAVDHVRAWVFRVAHNLAMNALRKRSRQEAEIPTDWEQRHDEQADPAPSAEERVIEQELQQRVSRALAHLSPQERYCLELKAEGLTYREIAETLDIRPGSVATFLARGVKKLTRWLQSTTTTRGEQ